MNKYLTIKEVNEHVQELITGDPFLNNIIIQAEIGSLTDRGHLYMTLKDQDGTSLKAILFNGYRLRCSYNPKVGDEVLLYGSLEVYVPSGTYQLIVRDITLYGEGARLLELEKLRKKLQSEGLFDENHKLSLPRFPQKIGIITAKSGAAIHDIVKNIIARYPLVELKLFDTLVQGENAPQEINNALKMAQMEDLDLIILGRGGGDKEDLNAFNDETLVRTIYSLTIPLISAVGHESDYTLVDYVADVRVSTPTAAAIKATPNINDLYIMLDHYKMTLDNFLKTKIIFYQTTFNRYLNHQFFRNPLSYFEGISKTLSLYKNNLDQDLKMLLTEKKQMLRNLQTTLNHHYQLFVETQINKLKTLNIRLNSLNPHAILQKGYSITTLENGKIIRSNLDLVNGQIIKTTTMHDVITSKVIKEN